MRVARFDHRSERAPRCPRRTRPPAGLLPACDRSRYAAGVDLDALPSRELVERTLLDHTLFPRASELLQARLPDDATSELLIEEYRTGRAPPWLAAHLLGCLRAPAGYSVVREILISAPGLTAEAYAGVALARIDPALARGDLLLLMSQGGHRRIREGALYGLGSLRQPDLGDAIVEAVRRGRVQADAAGSVIASLGLSHEALLAWLESSDALRRNVAVRAVFFLSARAGGVVPRPLARAAKTAMDSWGVKLAPSVRRMLRERIERSTAA